jgi:riboflavin biosynthesis pyrimidine reductase
VLSDVDVHDFYAADWLGPGGLRVNFVSSVDGAVTVGGLSRGLQTPGDNRVFAGLRDLADVVVAGAGTVRAEGYDSLHLSAEVRARRLELGVPGSLRTAVISRTLRLDPTADLFANADAEARTIVITCAAADPGVRDALSRTSQVIVAGEDEVDLASARLGLEELGLTRILCEGGPTLFGDLASAGVVDELCLTLSPLLGGPGAGRLTAGHPWESPVALRLAGLLEEDDALFARYRLAGGRDLGT